MAASVGVEIGDSLESRAAWLLRPVATSTVVGGGRKKITPSQTLGGQGKGRGKHGGHEEEPPYSFEAQVLKV